MALDTWKTPLEDLVDPTKLTNLAANDGDIPFVGNLAAASSSRNFAEAYRHIMVAISQHEKFKTTKRNAEQCSIDEKAWNLGSVNEQIFAETSTYIKTLLSNKSKDLSNEKRTAWQKAQTHLSAWRGAFSAHQEELAAAITVDLTLFANHGPISVVEAVELVKTTGDRLPDSLPEIVRWYLFIIRSKYRKDIEMLASQIECPKCHRKHDEGAECPRCREAKAALEAAKRALKSKNWTEAESKSKEVLEIWPRNAEADDICAEAQAGLDAERKATAQMLEAVNREIQTALDDAVAEGKGFSKVRAKVDEIVGKKLSGFDTDNWRLIIRRAEEKAEAERREKEEKERREKVAASTQRFRDALLGGKWAEAEKIAQELVKLGEGPIDKWRKEIQDAKNNRRKNLEDGCKNSLADFTRSFPADLDGAEAALNRAETALSALKNEFQGGPVIASTKREIDKGRDGIAAKRRENLVAGLRKVESLTATGSTDGPPSISVSWKPASGGTEVAKWRVARRAKIASGNTKLLGDFDSKQTSFSDRSDLKLGLEYVYEITPLANVGEGKFEPNKYAAVQSASAVCLTTMTKGAFFGSGQGTEGLGGIVTLQWKLPERLHSGVPHRFLLSRSDGKFREKDVSASNGLFEDENVTVGADIEYSLKFELCGRDMGTATIRVVVEKVPPPSPVGKFSFHRSSQGSLLVRWEWPPRLNACLWGVSENAATSPDDIAKTALRRVAKSTYDEKGGIIPTVPPNGAPCWLSVFGVRTFGNKEFVSESRSVPLRETVLDYRIETHQGGLFSKRKPAVLVLRSSTGYFPEMEIRTDANRTAVLSRQGGRVALRLGQESSGHEKRIALDGVAAQGEFIRIYLVRPDGENCKLKHPAEFEVK